MNALAARLLSLLSAGYSRAEMERHMPEFLPSMQRWGAAYAAYFDEVGIAPPTALIDLADAMADVYVHLTGADGWVLVLPEESRDSRRFLQKFALQFPDLAERGEMVPVFGKDGDLLLLARDGRIHGFTHDGWENDGVVAESFDALLEAFIARIEGREA